MAYINPLQMLLKEKAIRGRLPDEVTQSTKEVKREIRAAKNLPQ